ncbi:hypothetical protein ACG2LH_08255 [Zhouia sp. PK063]|uniref:hypothetical protein n=1 Tax=Zhouia sp. PK063 TaxID=3373602 RepID=UPI0037A371C3
MKAQNVDSLYYSKSNDSIAIKKHQFQVQQLEDQKKNILKEEKGRLKSIVAYINAQLKDGKISEGDAQIRKEKAAKKAALNIENRTAIVENQIALLERDWDYSVTDKDNYNSMITLFTSKGGGGLIYMNKNKKRFKYDIRTTSNPVIAFGLNNAIVKGQSFNDTPYQIGGSRFFEIGWQWKTRVFDNSNWLRFVYGFNFQFNGLKMKDDYYFVQNGNQTTLEEFPYHLNKSKFRMDNLVVPVFFEIGPSKLAKNDKYIRYDTDHKFRLGLGGFAGVNLSTRQKLKYKDEDGNRIKDKVKQSYNTNSFAYGLAGYIGFGDASLYVKYDLNPIFKSPNIEQKNIALGIKWVL